MTIHSSGIGWKNGPCSIQNFSFLLIIHLHVDPRIVRNYTLKKIQENNESEIMQCVLDEARESYAKEIVVELKSESTEDLENNVDRIVQWIRTWRKERGFEDKEGS